MKKLNGLYILFALLFSFSLLSYAEDTTEAENPTSYNSNQITHPEWFIKITDWSYFTAARVAMLSSVKIENTADIPYKDIKVRLLFYNSSGPAVGQTIATTQSVLPITIPPKSTGTYLKGGTTVGAGNQSYRVSDIQVLSATPITD
ncbi:MAG: hypothetical protein IH964_06390 [Candidatus Dadabacteria bacterium]|nr:hypothetical protein [Candidatus Dadabacteria bacterium]